MLLLLCSLPLMRLVAADILLPEERRAMEEFHLQLRENVQPPASNMLLMRFSTELERLINEWLKNCLLKKPDLTTFPQYQDTTILMAAAITGHAKNRMQLAAAAVNVQLDMNVTTISVTQARNQSLTILRLNLKTNARPWPMRRFMIRKIT
uniref:Interleukin-2 n=1 Tax=Mesocestoides corti TaxID=53468 RepID=A0A5K3FHC2_MESCO